MIHEASPKTAGCAMSGVVSADSDYVRDGWHVVAVSVPYFQLLNRRDTLRWRFQKGYSVAGIVVSLLLPAQLGAPYQRDLCGCVP